MRSPLHVEVTRELGYLRVMDSDRILIDCLCGQKDILASDEPGEYAVCPKCGRIYYFTMEIKIYAGFNDASPPPAPPPQSN